MKDEVRKKIFPFVLCLILIASFALKLPNLGHKSLKPLDEVFHAIVAQNLMKHPWTPTLNDGPAIEFEVENWQNAKVWLHKPPMAMWQIALSYAIFGINTLALRLPSLVLSTLAVWLTYLIGKELIDEFAGLLAAGLQAFNAPIAMLVHGHVFSDHVDISLLFWTELAIWFLLRAIRDHKRMDWVLCGVAQGLAFLSKMYPALIVTLLCGLMWALSRKRREGRAFAVVVIATALTVLPWNLYSFMRWPEQFIYENLHALSHLTSNVEQWAAPWDRLLFDFWVRIFHVYYPAVLVAAVFVTVRAIRSRDWKLCFLSVWGLGVLLPHLLATSKTMTATLVGWPAMWLMLGYLVSQAWRCSVMYAAALATAVVLPALLGAHIPTSGWGYPGDYRFGAIMVEHMWVAWCVLAALAVGAIVARWKIKHLSKSLATMAAIGMGYLALRYAGHTLRVKEVATDQPAFVELGAWARKLPADAVFMVDEQTKLENKLENKLIQFQARRTCYPLPQMQWQELGRAIVDVGGLPYLVSPKEVDLPVVFKADGRIIYACTPKARAAAEKASP